MNKKIEIHGNNAITLITLVITIIILIILSSVGIYLSLGNNGIFNKAQQAKSETIKQTATEKMNLKITNMQIEKYAKEQRMPTLQEFADELCEDNEIQYVELQSKKVGSLDKINVGNADSLFTKLKDYPYEFEINSSLQLASIDGVQVATNNITISKEEYENLKNNVAVLNDKFKMKEVTYEDFTISANKAVVKNFEIDDGYELVSVQPIYNGTNSSYAIALILPDNKIHFRNPLSSSSVLISNLKLKILEMKVTEN